MTDKKKFRLVGPRACSFPGFKLVKPGDVIEFAGPIRDHVTHWPEWWEEVTADEGTAQTPIETQETEDD